MNNIKIIRNDINGRYGISTRKIDRGEIVLIEEPYAFVPTDPYIEVSCAFCGLLNINGTVMAIAPDDTVRYCSEKCIINDYNYHLQSAEALKKLSKLGVIGSGSEPLRLILKIAGMRKIDNQKKVINIEDDIPLLGKENSFNHIKCLEAANKYIDPTVIEELKITSKTISKIASDYKLLLSDNEALHLLYAIQCNAHQILDENDRAIGLGLFPYTSMLNHNCAPNCAHHYEITNNGIPKLIMRAIKDIEPGSEICYSYVNLYSSTTTRRLKLEKAYSFQCNCSRCVSNDNVDECIDKGNGIEEVEVLGQQVQSYSTLLNSDSDATVALTVYDSLSNVLIELIPLTNIYHKYVLQGYVSIAKAGYKAASSSSSSSSSRNCLEILKSSFVYALLALGCIYNMTSTRQNETGELELLISQILYSMNIATDKECKSVYNDTNSDFLAFILEIVKDNGELNLYLNPNDNEVQSVIEYGTIYAYDEFRRLYDDKKIVKYEDIYISFASSGIETIRCCRGDEYIMKICHDLPSDLTVGFMYM